MWDDLRMKKILKKTGYLSDFFLSYQKYVLFLKKRSKHLRGSLWEQKTRFTPFWWKK